jgi:membrane-associated protein
VHDNFSLVCLGIVAVSVLPVLYELWAARSEGATLGAGALTSGRVQRSGGSLTATWH